MKQKGALGNIIFEPNPVFKEVRRLKKSPMLNGIKGVVTSGQDPTQLSFHLKRLKKKLKQ